MASCPYLHGTVLSRPYPGYVHGRRPAVCPLGCRPADPPDDHDAKAKLLREAYEFQRMCDGDPSRWSSIQAEVEATGTYELTFDELEFGARTAWRNAPKCANRKFWKDLMLRDERAAATNKDMFDACVEHVRIALQSGVNVAVLTCFPRGARVWNDQLLRFAAYRQPDGKIIGDPVNLEFTRMLTRRFGWTGRQTPFDLLPLVVQLSPESPPELFEMPASLPLVSIWHPDHPCVGALGLKWYAVPAVSSFELDVGGVVFTAVPFSGWYADVEIVRDLGDPDRYNALPKIVEALHKTTNSPIARDAAQVVLNEAVLYSFAHAKMTVVDHHTLIDGFYSWYQQELRDRGFATGNWKWIIPPTAAASTSQAYVGLKSMTEYTLKPGYFPGPGFRAYERASFASTTVAPWLAVLFVVKLRRRSGTSKDGEHAVIVFASVGGTTRRYAGKLYAALVQCEATVALVDAETIDVNDDGQRLAKADILIIISSTYGSGQVPSGAAGLVSVLHQLDLADKRCALLGFGSSNYPKFCGAIVTLEAAVKESRGRLVCETGTCDAVQDQHASFCEWTRRLVDALEWRCPSLDKGLKSRNFVVDLNYGPPPVSVEYLTRRDVELTMGERALKSTVVRWQSGKTDCTTPTSARSSVTAKKKTRLLCCCGTSDVQQHVRRSNSNDDDYVQVVKEPSLACCASAVRPNSFRRHRSLAEDSKEDLSVSHKDSYVPTVLDERVRLSTTTGRTYHVGKIIDVQSCFGDRPKARDHTTRATSLVRVKSAVPCAPGDVVRVMPQSVLSRNAVLAFTQHINEFDLDQLIVLRLRSSIEAKLTPTNLATVMPAVAAALDKPMTVYSFFVLHVGLFDKVGVDVCETLATQCPELACADADLLWIDLFDKCPSLSRKLTLGQLASLLPSNEARPYSIASACATGEFHLCVSRYLYTRDGQPHVGIASEFLTQAPPGTTILFTYEANPHFHLPPSPQTPLLLVAAGTGIAPIRSFIQHRLALRAALGPAVLVFGCRTPREFLFKEEICRAQRHGALDNVLVAYSRGRSAKRHVTDVLADPTYANIFQPLVTDPTVEIFICGSSNMATGVEQVLRDHLYGDAACFDALVATGRLHKEVFG